MHLIKDNQTMQGDELVLFDCVFCPMVKLSSVSFIEKWNSIPKKCQVKFSLGKFFTSRESSVIKRLQANNIMVSSFKTSSNITFLYLCCTTRDNSLILIELQMINTDFIISEVKYKSERLSRETELELFLQIILRENQDEEQEELLCR